MSKINLHLYPSTFKYESRILKETRSLSDFGIFDRIFIVAIWEKGVDEYESIDESRVIWRVKLRSRILGNSSFFKIVKFLEWMLIVFLRLRKDNVYAINCHSLSILPMGVLYKVMYGTTLVYDTHELETETCESRGIRRWLAKIVERFCIRFVDHTIVVSQSIASWYRIKYPKIPCTVVRNIPQKSGNAIKEQAFLRKKIGISDVTILFIYQGVIDRYRGIEILLNVFSKLGQDKHIVFLGYGSYVEKVQEYAKENKNIHFHPAVKPHELAAYTREADIGISLIENACLSYYYCLPNKVFEYMLGGIPIILSDFPEMGEFIRENKCGWAVKVDTEAILNLILTIDKKAIEEKKKGVIENMCKYNWKNEEKKMRSIYDNLLLS